MDTSYHINICASMNKNSVITTLSDDNALVTRHGTTSTRSHPLLHKHSVPLS